MSDSGEWQPPPGYMTMDEFMAEWEKGCSDREREEARRWVGDMFRQDDGVRQLAENK